MMENKLKAHAMLYKEDTWYREEIDRAANLFVRTYQMNDLLFGESRWDLLTDITKIIKLQNEQKKSPMLRPKTQINKSTMSSKTTSTTPPTTQKPQKRTRRTLIGPLALLGVGLGSVAAVNVISSSITGDTPLSWGGKPWAAFLALK